LTAREFWGAMMRTLGAQAPKSAALSPPRIAVNIE
jgi:hypothetical protein